MTGRSARLKYEPVIENGRRPPPDAGAAAIVTALARAGTRVLFGLPGGGPNLDVVGAAAAAGLRFVLTHGEAAAAIMAATYADLTGAPGAVVVTRGPGLASAANGIAHAALDRLPVVVIADTVRSAEADRISHQRLDLAALGRSVAKAVVTIGGTQARDAAAGAVRLALAPPPGPVVALMDDSATPPAPGPGSGSPRHGRTPRAAMTRISPGWPGRWTRRGGRWSCSARAPSRTPGRSGPRWSAAASRPCTPTGRAASCPTRRPRPPAWSPAARWSGRCWPPPTSSSGWASMRPR